MLRSGPATTPRLPRAAVPVAWWLVLLLPLHAFGVAFLPAWMPAHHHRGDAPRVASPDIAMVTRAKPVEATVTVTQGAAVAVHAHPQSNAAAHEQPPRVGQARPHRGHEHGGKPHRHAHAAQAEETEVDRMVRTTRTT